MGEAQRSQGESDGIEWGPTEVEWVRRYCRIRVFNGFRLWYMRIRYLSSILKGKGKGGGCIGYLNCNSVWPIIFTFYLPRYALNYSKAHCGRLLRYCKIKCFLIIHRGVYICFQNCNSQTLRHSIGVAIYPWNDINYEKVTHSWYQKLVVETASVRYG